jgi:complex III assembly factor LYRM7
MSTPNVLHAYRTLLRATRIAFANDMRLLLAARQQVRSEFLAPVVNFSNASNAQAAAAAAAAEEEKSSAQTAIEAKIRHALDVATVLRRNVVQAVQQEAEHGGDGRWSK